MAESQRPNYSPYPGDKIKARLEEGEVVMNRNAVRHYGKENLEQMNDAHPRYPVGMQKGGDPASAAIEKARQIYFNSPDMKPQNMFSRSHTIHRPENQYPITYSYPESGGIDTQSHRPRSQTDIFAQMQNVERKYRHVRPTVNGVNQYEAEMKPLQDAYIKKGLQYNNKPQAPFLKQKDSAGLDAKNAAIMDAKIVSEGKKRAKIDEMLATGPTIEQLDIRRGSSKITDSIKPIEAPHLPQGMDLDRSGKEVWDSMASKTDSLPSWDELNSAGTANVPKEDVDSNEWKQAQHWAQKLNESDYMFAPKDVKDAIGKRDSLMDMVRANQQRDELAMDIEEEIHAPNRARLAKIEADRQAQREEEMMTPPEMSEDKQKQFANYSLPGHENNMPINTIKEAIDGYDDGQKMGGYAQWLVGTGGTPADVMNYRHLAKKQGATDDQLSHIDSGFTFAMKERYGEPEELEMRQRTNDYADVFQPVDVPKAGPDPVQKAVGGLKGAIQRFAIGVHKGATGDKIYAQQGGYIGPDGRQHYLLGGAAALYGLGKGKQWVDSGKPQELLKGAQDKWGKAKEYLSQPMADPEMVKQMAKDDPAMWAGAKVGDTGKAIYEGGKAVAGGIGAAGKYLWEGRDDETHPGGGIKGAHKWGKEGGYEKIKQGVGGAMGFIGSMMKEAASPGYLDAAMSGQLDKTKGDIGVTVTDDTATGEDEPVSEVNIAELNLPPSETKMAQPGTDTQVIDPDTGHSREMVPTDTRQFVLPGDPDESDPFNTENRVVLDADGKQVGVKGGEIDQGNINPIREVDVMDPLAGGSDNTNVAKSAAGVQYDKDGNLILNDIDIDSWFKNEDVIEKSKGGLVRAIRKYVSGKNRKWDGKERRSPLNDLVYRPNRPRRRKMPTHYQKGGAVSIANKARRIYG